MLLMYFLCIILVPSFGHYSIEILDAIQFDINNIVKVIELREDGDPWINDGNPRKRLIGTAIQLQWVLTTASDFIIKSSGFWNFPNITVSLQNLRVLNVDGDWNIIYDNALSVSRLIIHPNFKVGRLTVYNAALLYTRVHVTRTLMMFYLQPWNFFMMEPAFILGIEESKLRMISVRIDHGLHECPCFIRQQAYAAICLFDQDREPGQCHVVNGSPVFLTNPEVRGQMVGFLDAYYSLDDCIYKVFIQPACVESRVFYSAIALCSLFNFVNRTMGKNYALTHECVACEHLPLTILIILLLLLVNFIK